jgi:hypothetical protein
MEKKAAAGLEPSTITDPRTGRAIRVAVPVRIKYRKYFRGQETEFTKREVLNTLSNRELNDEIAKDFAAASNDVVHMFYSKDSDLTSSPKRIVWMEIRKQNRGERAAFNFFISKISEGFIDILTVTQGYKKPTRPRVVSAAEDIYSLIARKEFEDIIKEAASNKHKTGKSVSEIIGQIRSRGKSLTKPKREINEIIRKIKDIEEDGYKKKKDTGYILTTIKKILPDWY